MAVTFCETAFRGIAEGCHLHTPRLQNLNFTLRWTCFLRRASCLWVTFIEPIVGYKLHLECRIFDSLVFLSVFCLYSCSFHFVCCAIFFLTFSILQLYVRTVLFIISFSRQPFPLLFVFFRCITVFGHMPSISLEAVFLIPIFGSILVNCFLTICPSNFFPFATQVVTPSFVLSTYAAYPLFRISPQPLKGFIQHAQIQFRKPI
jgi:hypothetical protein